MEVNGKIIEEIYTSLKYNLKDENYDEVIFYIDDLYWHRWNKSVLLQRRSLTHKQKLLIDKIWLLGKSILTPNLFDLDKEKFLSILKEDNKNYSEYFS